MVRRYEQAACFAAVAESGSFTKAAASLGCSKAHLSKQVGALESSLGAQLLLRTTRRIALTEAGRTYLSYCRKLRDALADAERAVADTHSSLAGTLYVTVPPSLGEAFLLDAILEFQSRYPRVAVALDLSVAHRDLVGQGLDFAIRSSRTLDRGLVARPLARVADVLVAAPELLARHPAIRAPSDLARVPCLSNPLLKDAEVWRFDDDTVRIDARLTINHFGALLRAALRGAGVARLPRYLVSAALADGRLQRVLPEHRDPSTPIYLVYPQRRLPQRNRAFRDFILAWFADPARADWLA